MSTTFLEERREFSIQPENNTAQQQLLDFLENLHPSLTEIVVKEPMTGDLDFQILKECNFTNVSSLQFAPGNITSIRNIPDHITQLICPRNLLVELEDLPPRITVLEVNENGIKYMNFRKYTALKILNISQNLFIDIRNLPSSLEKLYCSNNRIKILDLDGVENLSTLHCENNMMIVVQHFPDTITDLRMENNPNIETNRDDDHRESVNPTEKHLDVDEALNKYFKLKAKYEKDRLQKKRDTYIKGMGYGVGKRKLLNQINSLRHKCINCKNLGSPEGTIFKVTDRTYTAICGADNPCSLNIRIFAGVFSDLYYYYRTLQNSIEYSKSEMIQHKLDSIFNYVKEEDSIKRFKEIMADYNGDNEILREIKEDYNNIYNNKEREEKITEKKYEIESSKSKVKEWLEKYSKTGNREVLTTAMEFYVNELLPEIRNLRFLLNEINEMNILENTNKGGRLEGKRILFQEQNQLSKIDYTFGEPAKVEKFM
jgi:hypothetical protein